MAEDSDGGAGSAAAAAVAAVSAGSRAGAAGGGGGKGSGESTDIARALLFFLSNITSFSTTTWYSIIEQSSNNFDC
jgi:hypothetical protein